MASGIGFWYGHTGSDASVLEDLLKDSEYDFEGYDQEDIDAVASVVARMPQTMEQARPYDVRWKMHEAELANGWDGCD